MLRSNALTSLNGIFRSGILRQKSLSLVFRAFAHAVNEVKLRDYQLDAVKSTLEAIDRGVKRPAVVLATGGGKTVVMSHLIPRLKSFNKGDKVLVLAHKQELVRQAAHTIHSMNPDLRVTIDMLTSRPDLEGIDVIIGSVPTLVYKTRLDRYNPNEFKAIILDECHHATAHSWMKILNHFGALDEDPKICVIGFTATLDRSDGISLGKVFQEIVFERNLITMIRAKELCDVRLSKINVKLGLENVKTHQGDFVQKDLSDAVNKEDINVTVTRGLMQLKKKYNFKSTLVFCVDIAHCKTLCGVLQRNGISAQYVTGNTVSHERRAILEDFKDGKIEVLCNVLVFTEGTDIPNIDSLVLARPTQSRSLLIQMIGRGLRLHQLKDICDVIDMVDATKHGLESTPTLLGLEQELKAAGKTEEQIDKSMEELLESAMLTNTSKDEEERLREEQRVFETLQRLSNLGVKFQTIEGFADIEGSKKDAEEVKTEITQAIRSSKIPWARLGYNQWGITIGKENYVLQRSGEEYQLAELVFTSLDIIIASKYKSERYRFRPIRQSKDFKALVMAADTMLFRKLLTSGFQNRPATEKQASFLASKLKTKVGTTYGKSADDIKEIVRTWRLGRAANLILATKLSINSLWVKWELAKMFGFSNETESRMRREIKKIDRKRPDFEDYVPKRPADGEHGPVEDSQPV